MWIFLHKMVSPHVIFRFANRCGPFLAGIACLFFLCGLVSGLVYAPADYQQGDVFRIIYLHVPAAILSLFIYVMMTVTSAIFMIWHLKIADAVAKASAALGAGFTAAALLTGSIWGRPTWGTWWIWDARLTSELILLFLYLGIMALRSSIPNATQSARVCAFVTLVGVINLPIIHYSVYWWHTLHQGATLLKWAKPAIAPAMLYPLLLMIVAFFTYYFWLLSLRLRTEFLIREAHTQWVRAWIQREDL